MKKKLVVFLLIALTALPVIGYALNVVKLTKCDFVEPYKCEVVHSVGLIPFIGAFIGWLEIKDGK